MYVFSWSYLLLKYHARYACYIGQVHSELQGSNFQRNELKRQSVILCGLKNLNMLLHQRKYKTV